MQEKEQFDTDEPERRHFIIIIPIHESFVRDKNVHVN